MWNRRRERNDLRAGVPEQVILSEVKDRADKPIDAGSIADDGAQDENLPAQREHNENAFVRPSRYHDRRHRRRILRLQHSSAAGGKEAESRAEQQPARAAADAGDAFDPGAAS